MLTRYRYQNFRNGLVGHWRPSRGATGNTLLDSVRGNHGTLVNGPTWQASGSGLALNFDGVDDHVDCGTTAGDISTGNFSIGFWIKSSSTQQYIAYVGKNNGLLSGTGLGWMCGNQGLTAGAVISGLMDGSTQFQLRSANANLLADGLWHHFAMIINRSADTRCFLAVDGKDVTATRINTPPTGSISNVSSTWMMRQTGGTYVSGQLDDVFISSRDLTLAEIKALYTAGRGALDQRVNVPVVRGFTSGGAYALTADSGTFALSGQNATVTANRVLTADQASFTAAGQTANLLRSRLLTADQATFTTSGQAADLLRSRLLTVDQATFTAIGQDAALKASRLLTADQATYTLSGQDVALVSGNTLTAENATFTLAGQTASFVLSRRITADQAAFALSGQDATLTYSGATSEVPYLEIDFVSGNRATGTLTTLAATGSISVIQATGTLVVSEAES